MDSFLKGLRDALSIKKIMFIMSNPRIFSKMRKTWLLNFLLLLGSIVILDYIFLPSLVWLFGSHNLILTLIQNFYYLFFLYPIYMITLLLNGRWYSRIARESITERAREIADVKLKSRDRKLALPSISSKEEVTKQIANDLYRLIFGLIYLGQCAVIAKLPFIGTIAFLISSSWLSSLYIFEYVWSLLGLNQQQRLTYFSQRYLYMLGYGLPLALNGYFLPPLIRDAIFALLFPIFIINSVWAKPCKIETESWLPNSFNPFWLSQQWVTPLLKNGFNDTYTLVIKTITMLGKMKKFIYK